MRRYLLLFFLCLNTIYAELLLDDWSGARVDEIFTDKLDIYKLACEHNNSEACYALGVLYTQNYAQNPNNTEYLKNTLFYLNKACNQNYEKACTALGILYVSKDFKYKDESTAIKYFDRSCNMGNIFWCVAMSKYYEDEKHLDIKKSISYLEIACDKKSNEACGYIGLLYHDGKKIEADYKKARIFYEKSMEINPEVPSNYLNIFEINLVQYISFDKKMEKDFLKRFRKDKQSMMFYDMLKILQNIELKKNYNLNGWKKRYRGMNLEGWDFDTIDSWIKEMRDGKVKSELSKTVNEFKKFKKSKIKN